MDRTTASKPPRNAALSLIQLMINHSRAILPRLPAFTDQGASAQDYTEELARHLLRRHQVLDAAAQKVGRDPLGWDVPDYRRFAGTPVALPLGPRGSVLPKALARDFRKALESRACSRPQASLGAVYQAFRNEIAKVDRAFLRFVPKPPESLLPAAKKAMVRFGRIKKR